ncbi:MAG: rhomboid family intramembrane serine protease [Chitinophagales bacterium]|nr:rhomboid family intramembrane serine protease [Chitinophagales bacterium]
MRRFEDIPDVTKNLLILNVFVYLIIVFFPWTIHLLGNHYISSKAFYPFQIITSIFVHDPLNGRSGIFHLIFNMYLLYSLGSVLEYFWGPKKFGFFYLSCGIGANILELLINAIRTYKFTGVILISETTDYDLSQVYNILHGVSYGASGAIFGLLIAVFMLFPSTRVNLIFPPIELEYRIYIPILIFLEFYLATNKFQNDNINHIVHLSGAFLGYMMIYYWNKRSNTFY